MFNILKKLKKSTSAIIAFSLILVVAIFTFAIISNKSVFADDNVVTYDTRSSENSNLSEEDKQAVLDRLVVINECIDNLKENITSINKSIENIRAQSEYEVYPAVRLNIDTPLFGIVSVINNKLKISDNVSTMDVAKGYSIKDIIKQNKVKVPSLSVGSFVVLTRDVEFDENITIADADTSILLLFKYLDQTSDIKDFLNNQTTKIFQGYISKEKKDSMTDTSNRINSIRKSLKDIDSEVVAISILYSDNENYNQYVDKYTKLIDESYSLQQKNKNILITETDLKSIQKSTATLEANTIDFVEETDNIYLEISKDIDILKMFKNVSSKLTEKQKDMKLYIDNSYKKVEKIDNNSTDASILEDKIQTDTVITQEEIYPVISKDSIDTLNELITKINVLIVTYIPADSYITEIPEEVINKADVINAGKNIELTTEKKVEILEEVVGIYSEAIVLENEFYSNNIDVLLQDSQNKISDIIGYTDSESLSNLNDIYIDIPKNVATIISKMSNEYTINLNSFNSLIITKNNEVLNLNKTISKIYKDNNTNNVVDSTRE